MVKEGLFAKFSFFVELSSLLLCEWWSEKKCGDSGRVCAIATADKDDMMEQAKLDLWKSLVDEKKASGLWHCFDFFCYFFPTTHHTGLMAAWETFMRAAQRALRQLEIIHGFCCGRNGLRFILAVLSPILQ